LQLVAFSPALCSAIAQDRARVVLSGRERGDRAETINCLQRWRSSRRAESGIRGSSPTPDARVFEQRADMFLSSCERDGSAESGCGHRNQAVDQPSVSKLTHISGSPTFYGSATDNCASEPISSINRDRAAESRHGDLGWTLRLTVVSKLTVDRVSPAS